MVTDVSAILVATITCQMRVCVCVYKNHGQTPLNFTEIAKCTDYVQEYIRETILYLYTYVHTLG